MAQTDQSVIPASHLDLLSSTALAHAATIGPDGAPQSNPVWFIWDGEFVRIAIPPDRQKARNLRSDPRIALSIVDPANPARYLEIRGRVVEFDPDADGTHLRRIVHRYTGSEDLSWVPGARVIISVEPIRTSHMG